MQLFTSDHEAFRQRARTFVENELGRHAEDWERRRSFPLKVYRDLGDQGFLGLTLPRELGGGGLDFGYAVAWAEELPRCRMMGLGLSVTTHTHVYQPLLARLGTEEQKRQFLEPAIRGSKIGALASCEVEGGSDLIRGIRCLATEQGDDWVINGVKSFIPNSPIADSVVALVRTREDASLNSLSLVIVPSDCSGFRVRETPQPAALGTSPIGSLAFDNCRVSKRLTLGKPHLGYHYLSRILLEDRLLGGAYAVAIAGLALEETLRFVREQKAYGQALSRQQTIRHRCAELAAEVEVNRRFVHSICASYRDGLVETKEICMIRFHVFDMVQRVLHQCLEIHSGWGFAEQSWLARMCRDVRALALSGGPSEAMKDIVAAHLRM